jgi:hypothetical protein
MVTGSTKRNPQIQRIAIDRLAGMVTIFARLRQIALNNRGSTSYAPQPLQCA